MRLWPRSLLGQTLLAVALALLVAQAISVILQYRAQLGRASDLIANTAVNRLAESSGAGPRRVEAVRADIRANRGAPDGNWRGRRPLPRLPVIETATPQFPDTIRRPMVERAVGSLLEAQGIGVRDIRVQLVDTVDDAVVQQILQARPRLARRRPLPRQLALVSIQPFGGERWTQIRVPVPERSGGALLPIILQTVVLYLVLIGGLWLVLRRIVGPLRALAGRVEQFAETQSAAEPMDPAGPDESRRLIAAHNALERRIVALLDEKDVMLGAIGHDLKTPLAALRVRIENVNDAPARAKMAASIDDLARSLDDILTLARVGRPSDALERVELSALAAALVEEYEDTGAPVMLGETQRMAARARVTWLRRALRNLVTNGLRYGTNVQLSLERVDNEAVFTVADDGPGIPDDQIEAMMQPFQRGEASRNRETGGAGLGLTLARAIAQQHGGSLELVNRPASDTAPAGLDAKLRIPL